MSLCYEIQLITSELAADLARFPGLNTRRTEKLNALKTLFVNAMIVIAEEIEDAQNSETLEDIRRIAVKQLWMIIIKCSRLVKQPLTEFASSAQ